ncbi:MAG: hypothetical protein IPN90_07920 [Elusimicrobia bacterium]|nr:hypothetical protein [Elusimicrobiota bacterium]
MYDSDFRALRWASHLFFWPFLAISLVPYILPFLGIPVLGITEQWMFGGALVSSLLHGLYNSFSLIGKVAALGDWAFGRRRLTSEDTVVVGDLEQRVDVLHRILKAEGLYAANGEISKSIKNGPKIVQVGDFIGRSKGVSAENLPGALASARGVFDLQGKIEAAGGELILLLGNHEYQVLIGSPVGGDFTEEEMKTGPDGSPSEVDQLRELLIEKIKSGHVKLAHVLKQNGEDTLLTHAGVRESMLGTMVQEGFLSDDLLNQVNGGQPLTLKSARNVESFFNGVVKILADKVPSSGGATNFQKEFRTLFNRDFGIFGANGPLSRVARFQDTELAKGFSQIFGHTAGSVVRRQEAPPSPTEDLSSRVAGSNALNVDASVGRGRPIYARVRAKASTQMSEAWGRHNWRKLSTPHFEGEWARPANVWGWIGFVVDRVHLWVEPEEWIQNAAHAAGNIAELVAVHRQFNDHLAHLSRWGVRKALGGLYRSGFDAIAKGIDSQIGIRQDDWDMYDRVYKRRVEELLAVWKSLGMSSNIGSLLFQLSDENPDFNQKPSKDQEELNLEGTTSPVVRMKEVAINEQTVGLPGIYEVEIHFAQNREGILADVSAVIGAHGFFVLGASVNRIQGSVFDKFWVMSPDPLDGERLRNLVIEIESDIQDLLQGKVSYEEIYEKRMVSDGGYIFQRVPGSEKVVTSVQFSEREYRDFAVRRSGGGSVNKTVIRIHTAERIQPGLLHLIARFLFENDLVVGPPAYPIRTRGLSIFDEFSVEPKPGGKALDSERKAQIERDLKALLEKDTITALDFAQPSSVELTQQETLARSLLGGPAEEHLSLWGYTVVIDHLRVRVEKDRAHLAAQRKALARTLGLGSLASVSALARAAARSHGRRSTDFEQENEIQASVRSQIELLLALAYDQGKGDAERAQSSVVETVRVYHEAQKMSDDESSLMAAIETGKEIALEMTPAMWEDDSKQISEREKAQWRRLKIISQAVSEGKLKKHVRLIVPDGVTAREVAPVLKSRGLSLRGYYLTKPKSDFRMVDGKYSVNKFVSWLAEDVGRFSDPGSIDMYLMDRSEWDWDNLIARIRKNIRLLVDVLPGLVVDATNRLPDELKRIVAINVAA